MVLKHVNADADFGAVLEEAGSKLVVVDFFATWCVAFLYSAKCWAISSPMYGISRQSPNNNPSCVWISAVLSSQYPIIFSIPVAYVRHMLQV
jgi:hypothetical protein